MKQKVGIIGGGISSYVLICYLSNRSDLDISLIDGSDYLPACSDNSTAINCLRGIKKGVSPLGDLLVDSYKEFLNFMDMYNPEGVSLGEEYILSELDDEKFSRRYQKNGLLSELSFISNTDLQFTKLPAYFIDFEKIKNWVQGKYKFNHIKDFVLSISNTEVTAQKDNYHFDKLVLCTNKKNENILELTSDVLDFDQRSKPVRGSYLECKQKLNLDSISIKLPKGHFIYRSEEELIQIGTTSDNDLGLYAECSKKLDIIYNDITEYLNLDIPSRERFEVKTGVRLKGRKRTPFWGEVSKNQFMISGLYKNGFSFPFLASQKIINLL